MKRDLLEFADDRCLIFDQERMKIVENKNGWLHLFHDLVQSRERFPGRRVAIFLGLDGGTRRGHPQGRAPMTS